MGDIECSHTSVANSLLDGHQHVNLCCHIQRGCWLVKHHQIRFRTQRKRGHAALQLPTRHLVRIAVADVLRVWQAQFSKQFNSPALGLLLGEFALEDRSLGYLIHDLFGWVERGRCGLAHIGHFSAAQGAHVGVRSLQDVAPVDPNFATGDFDTTAPVCHRRQANGRLASARLSNETKNFALLNFEAHAMYDFDIMRFFSRRINRCANLEVLDFEKRIAHPRPPFSEVVRFRIQSATRFTEIAKVAMATAG
mmetsp:Transcript_18295/g.29190  ORF Transcript_18295/g.29190 Transcript_18295/m.29190 type:complete len:251 (-) Transcript_18295:7125-7877(-)